MWVLPHIPLKFHLLRAPDPFRLSLLEDLGTLDVIGVHNSSVSNVDDNSIVSQENRFLTYVEDFVNHLTFSVSHSRLNKTNSRAYVDPCFPSPISTVSHSNVSQTNRCWNVSHRVLLNVSNSNDTSI